MPVLTRILAPLAGAAQHVRDSLHARCGFCPITVSHLPFPPEFLAVLAAVCWALSALFSAPVSRKMGAFAFTRWRMVFASAVLGGWATLAGTWGTLNPPLIGVLVLSGFIGIFIGDTVLFACMIRLGPRRSGILFATHSMMSAVLAALFLGERMSGLAMLGCTLLVAGVMTAIAFGKRAGSESIWEATRGRLAVGVGLGLVAALGQALGTLIVKPVMGPEVDPIAASAIRMMAGFGFHAALLVVGWKPARLAAAMTVRDWGLVSGSAFLSMVLGMTLILAALQYGSAGLVAMLSSISPILLLPLLWWKTRVPPTLGACAGAVLTVVGVVLILARTL